MTGQQYRLATVGLIDRERRVTFEFNGQPLEGYEGDTIASALLANGVQLVGRSFKYHRPRGILTAGPEEPNALVELRTGARREPNTRATTTEIYNGLSAISQNCWPSVKWDLRSWLSILTPFLGAGFYYKTFMWPAAFWERLYEPLIRRSAGLGEAPTHADPDYYERANAFCDVLVIGAGPAGLMAALAAGCAGARVILCEQDFALGGRCLSERDEIDGQPASRWVRMIEQQLDAMPEVRIMRRTTIFGVYDGRMYGALQRVCDHVSVPATGQPRQRVWRIVARECVLSSGGVERPLVFGNNDKPGLMLAGAVRSYINRYAVVSGRRAVVLINNDGAARTASDLAAAGTRVEGIVDVRPNSTHHVRKLASALSVPLYAGAAIRHAIGGRHIEGVEIGSSGSRALRLPCDLVAMSGGWTPSLELTCHLGGRLTWDDRLGSLVHGPLPPGMVVAGGADGKLDLKSCLKQGSALGAAAAAQCGFDSVELPIPAASIDGIATGDIWCGPTHRKAFIDFQNDVTLSDVELAHREGFQSVEHVKRYTTLGMGTDQGRTSNVNALAIVAGLSGSTMSALGTTTSRAPSVPVAIGALAGPHRREDFQPVRYTPTHQWAVEQGAAFVDVGLWLRARYFPRADELDWRDTVKREISTVRSKVGICDISTLGKIDIQGRDAGVFLDRVYCNMFSTLPIGKCRYGLMLREDGFIFDDGTTSRLGAQHYYMTTTTANAAKVMQHLEFYRQCVWPELDLQMVSVTETWAQFAIAGPQSRALLQRLVDAQIDISNEAFPYMAVADVRICNGIRARLFRLSFSGELAYELAVPARYGEALMRETLLRGAEFGITPYGMEALGTMRIEKGHVAGAELNGQTTAHDLGLAKMLSNAKDFVGAHMARRAALTSMERPMLVGLKPRNNDEKIMAGGHLVAMGARANAENDHGHVTSVAFSPTLNHWIGLGLLRNGTARLGETIRVCDPVRHSELFAEVCRPCFVDPSGERLRE